GNDRVLRSVSVRPQHPLRRWNGGLHRLLLWLRDHNLAGLVYRRLAPDHVDLVLAHEEAGTGVELSSDPTRPLRNGSSVEFQLPFDTQAVALGVRRIAEDVCRTQKRLGRDAPPVEADASQVLPLHHCRLETELRGADGRYVAPEPGTDHGDIVGFARHGVPYSCIQNESSALGPGAFQSKRNEWSSSRAISGRVTRGSERRDRH